MRPYFKRLPGYSQSVFDPSGNDTTGIPHQDLECLTFPDSAFDLVLSSDILEHVRDPLRAFSETYRVLRDGGLHIFTVPLQRPIPPKTIRRVDSSSGQDVHLLPPRYHGDGQGGKSLVYTDFGLDIVDMLTSVGFDATLASPNTPSAIANSVCTVVCAKGKR
jgi:SAM-dependent methyltransferase